MSFIRAAALSLTLIALPLCAHADDALKVGEPAHVGSLTLSGGFTRATLPNAPVGGGFLTIENTGKDDDRLIGAASDITGHMEVHEMVMEGDVMKMRQLKDGLLIPAGKTTVLKPGGYHIMFIDLKGPLVEGQTVKVTLTFEKAGKVDLNLVVDAPNAGSHGSLQNDTVKFGAIKGVIETASGQIKLAFAPREAV